MPSTGKAVFLKADKPDKPEAPFVIATNSLQDLWLCWDNGDGHPAHKSQKD